jgi:hypothetical protein
MKKRDKKLENKIGKLIKLLAEQDPPVAGAAVQPTQPQPQHQQQPQQQQAQAQQPQQPKQIALGKAQVDTGTKMQYLSTINMYTSPTPPDSAEWKNEVKQKRQFAPLTDARIVNSIKKYFPALRVSSAKAAKYSDFQFRIILGGSMKADAEIKVTTEDKKAFATLENINIDNSHRGVGGKGNSSIINAMKEKNRIPINAKLEDIRNWAKAEPKLKEPDPEEEPEEEEGEKETWSEPEEHPYYDDLLEVARGKTVGFKTQRAAKKFVNWFIKKESPPTKGLSIEAITSLLMKNLEDWRNRGEASESINISSYIRSLMLEKKKIPGAELESGRGGDLLRSINHNLEIWFKHGGIAASTDNRIFRGNIYEWFAVRDANFTLGERKVEAVNRQEVEVTMTGQLKMEVEVWVDARIGEQNGNLSSWSFRVLDAGKERVLDKSTILNTSRMVGKMGADADAQQSAERLDKAAGEAEAQVKSQAKQPAQQPSNQQQAGGLKSI